MSQPAFLSINTFPTTASQWAVRIGIIAVIAAVVVTIRLGMRRRK